MQTLPDSEVVDFPGFGSRARRWGRFERDLAAWLDSPHGQFAVWCADRTVAGQPPFCRAAAAHAAQRPRTTSWA